MMEILPKDRGTKNRARHATATEAGTFAILQWLPRGNMGKIHTKQNHLREAPNGGVASTEALYIDPLAETLNVDPKCYRYR